MVYTYRDVEKLNAKLDKDEEISEKEISKLERYVEGKSKVATQAAGRWARKQLANAEIVLYKIRQNQAQSNKATGEIS